MLGLLLFVVLLGGVGSIVYWTLVLGISPMPSTPQVARKIAQLVAQYPVNTVVELGSGWGTLALCIAKNNPQKQVIAYERSVLPYGVSLLLKLLFRVPNVTFKKENFLTHLFTQEEIAVAYLCPSGMAALWEKGQKSGFPLALLSVTFALRHVKPHQTLNLPTFFGTTLFVYRDFKAPVLQ